MFFKHQIISRINKPMSRLLILILVFCFPLFSQVLTGSLGLRGGINYNVFNDQEGNKWTGSGQHIALEIGVNLIRPLELVTNVSYLTTNYSYSDTNIIYYTKYSKQYNNIYIPFRLRLNLWTFGFLQPNIEFGGAIKKQYSGYRQTEYHIPFRHPLPNDSLETDFGLLFGFGAKIHLMPYLSVIPSIHYQRDLGESNSCDILFSLGISYGG